MRRILNSLDLDAKLLFEVIIFDDSRNESVIDEFRKFKGLKNKIKFHKNCRSSSAVRNWNSLINFAQGEFVILMHHDEFPLINNFIKTVALHIKRNSLIDVFIMECFLFKSKKNQLHRFLPMYVRFNLAKFFPRYILKRNIIGPTSTLIIRSAICPRFDEKLQWFVDVDFYHRLILKTNKWLPLPNVSIGSVCDRNDSISSKISHNLPLIKANEKGYLQSKYNIKTSYLCNCIENIAWYSFRILYTIYSKFIIFFHVKSFNVT